MDFVPFTIFFMACLIVFHGSLASPHSAGCRVLREWPEPCRNNNYCFHRPATYPLTHELQEMIKYSKFDISDLEQFEKPKMDDRSGGCRAYNMNEAIYLIKNENNDIRYVVQDTKVANQTVQIRKCKRQIQPNALVKCVQKFQPSELLVTTCDGRVEKMRVKLPSGCSQMEYQNNDY